MSVNPGLFVLQSMGFRTFAMCGQQTALSRGFLGTRWNKGCECTQGWGLDVWSYLLLHSRVKKGRTAKKDCRMPRPQQIIIRPVLKVPGHLSALATPPWGLSP